MRDLLQTAVGLGALRAVDYHFARHLAELAGEEDPLLLLAAALVSHRVGEGDVCIDLADCADFPLFQIDALAGRIRVPLSDEWVRSLRRWPVVGQPGERAPLILDDKARLYLGRYWHFEHLLVQALQKRTRGWAPELDRERLRQGLVRLFPQSQQIDWQRIAAAVALLQPFCVISGGPGTGKTRTVTSILALLAEQAGRVPPRIALAAPTGKAAARLTESIRTAKRELPLDVQTARLIPEETVTLHRLLGFRPGRANPRHGPDNPLHLDVLVVDEASMVDLPLMARLLDALPERARLILLGDKDQLASVEAGMVLGDICGRGVPIRYSDSLCAALMKIANVALDPGADFAAGISDHIVMLRKSWRFAESSGIGALARAVNLGEAEKAIVVLEDAAYPDVSLVAPQHKALNELIVDWVIPAYREVAGSPDPATALQALNRMRVLCAVRAGPYGVQNLNTQIEQALEAEGLIKRTGDIYAGRPVMVSSNDHAQRLYNGDVGLLLPDVSSGGALRVFFETSEGIRRVLPSRMPPHETVYAMTVHKSQGSEFDQVLLVLPEEQSRVVTRELVYTGITRAKRQVIILAAAENLQQAAGKPLVRSTGLYDALWHRPWDTA